MKKIILIFATFVFASSANSQNQISLRGGLSKQFETGSITFFGPGASFQYGLNENTALGLNFDYHIGESSTSLINIEPRLDYYLNSVYNGIHIGSNIGFNMYSVAGTSSKALQLGALLGYTHPLSDNLTVDLSCGAGLGMSLESGGGSNFGVRPALSLGYKLGGK
jgi:hypothetical protein